MPDKNFEKIVISVIGLGYVGLPLALAFADKTKVIGFDTDMQKIASYKAGTDVTKEVGNEAIANTSVIFTSDEKLLRLCNFHIIAVPTPINRNHSPNLKPLISACEILGRNLKKGSVAVLESTVFPGATEEICIPVLENSSGMKCGRDFKIGYSPERINPGDKFHKLNSIVKIVSGMDGETLETIAGVYEMIIDAGVYRVSCIKAAEAAKIIENIQRDINIAFVNEISMILGKMGIDTYEVLEAAGTKWNFLKFYPGLVGGHCIGVDSCYLLSRALELGCHSEMIHSARKLNNSIGKYAAELILNLLIKAGKKPLRSKVLIMGITFKENVSDTRNSGVISVISELENHGIEVLVCDPLADSSIVKSEYGIELREIDSVKGVDAIVFAVSHSCFKNIDLKKLRKKYRKPPYILFDLKRIFNKEKALQEGYLYAGL